MAAEDRLSLSTEWLVAFLRDLADDSVALEWAEAIRPSMPGGFATLIGGLRGAAQRLEDFSELEQRAAEVLDGAAESSDHREFVFIASEVQPGGYVATIQGRTPGVEGVRAAWEVLAVAPNATTGQTFVRLRPVQPHDIPPMEPVRDLRRPLREAFEGEWPT